MKKLSILGMTLLLMSSILAACGGGDKGGQTASEGETPSGQKPAGETYENGLPKDEKVTLKYGFFQGGLGREWMDDAIKSFTAKYPNVKIELTASPDISNILSTKISAGNDNDMFDMFNRDPAGGVVTLAEAGKLEPMDEMWERKLTDTPDKTVKDAMMDGFYESANRINGKSYAIPTSGSFGGLFFNKKLFEEHGWNQNPQTWTEFEQLLADIKADGIVPITFPGMHPTYYDWAFGAQKLFELADMKGKADEFIKNYENYTLPEYLSEESVERWNRMYELGKKGYFAPGLPALNHTQSQMQVIQGQVAMVSSGSHIENEMKNSTPEGFEWGYMSPPFRETADQQLWIKSSTTNGQYIWAAKPDLNKKWAKEFVLHLLSLEVQQVAAEKGGAFPLRKDLTEKTELAAKLQTSTQAVLKYINDNKAKTYKASRAVSLSSPESSQAGKILEEAIPNIFLGKQDPKPILEQSEALLKKAIEKEQK